LAIVVGKGELATSEAVNQLRSESITVVAMIGSWPKSAAELPVSVELAGEGEEGRRI